MAAFRMRNSGPLTLRNIKVTNIPTVVDAENSGKITAENVVVECDSPKEPGPDKRN